MESLIDIGALIERSPEIRDGRARIAGTGVTVRRVATWYRLGLSPEEIGDRIGHISLAQVHAALAYYHANQRTIDSDIEAEEAETELLEATHVSRQSVE